LTGGAGRLDRLAESNPGHPETTAGSGPTGRIIVALGLSSQSRIAKGAHGRPSPI